MKIEIHLNNTQTAYVDVSGIGHPVDRDILARQMSTCPLVYCTKYNEKEYRGGVIQTS